MKKVRGTKYERPVRRPRRTGNIRGKELGFRNWKNFRVVRVYVAKQTINCKYLNHLHEQR